MSAVGLDVVFHREINRGVARVVGPPVRATLAFFGGPAEQEVRLRPTIAPDKRDSGKGQI